jgi:hypothetical protein
MRWLKSGPLVGGSMRRRDFIAIVGCAAPSRASVPFAVHAQQTGIPTSIGFLGTASAQEGQRVLGVLRKGSGEPGYVEGRTMSIEDRWAEERYDQLSAARPT